MRYDVTDVPVEYVSLQTKYEVAEPRLNPYHYPTPVNARG